MTYKTDNSALANSQSFKARMGKLQPGGFLHPLGTPNLVYKDPLVPKDAVTHQTVVSHAGHASVHFYFSTFLLLFSTFPWALFAIQMRTSCFITHSKTSPLLPPLLSRAQRRITQPFYWLLTLAPLPSKSHLAVIQRHQITAKTNSKL